MVEPEHYRGIPGSGAAEAQPFRIEVTPCAQVCIASLTLPVQDNSALQACCSESRDLCLHNCSLAAAMLNRRAAAIMVCGVLCRL